MRRLEHDHIVKYIGHGWKDSYLYIAMEKCEMDGDALLRMVNGVNKPQVRCAA